MGIFSSMFNKMGSWHVRQLVKDCTKLMIKASMSEMKQKENPYLTDSTIDSLVKHLQYEYAMGLMNFKSLKEKYSYFVRTYVLKI